MIRMSICFAMESIKYLSLFVLVFFILGIIFINTLVRSESVGTKVIVEKSVSISLSNNLSSGIIFGNIEPNANNNNATGNFNSTDHTQFWVTIDSSTNTPIDICIKDNANLSFGSYNIPNNNFKWNSTTINSQSLPIFNGGPTAHALNTTYDTVNKIASNVYNGTYYLRFTLDVSVTQQAGIYNNTVYFKGVSTDIGC